MTAHDTTPDSDLTIDTANFVVETLVTDTVAYEVVGRTAATMKIRPMLRGEVVSSTSLDGNPWPVVIESAVVAETAPVRTLRRRQDGTFRTGRSSNPLRPAANPTFRTDYRH